ncbi:hypothetical protein Syun_023257 [Stephania yunnanensis]|uniref:Uncharacterized protein n=1 Tax=Stephania yunnanensis TaxID=152371 RepID=A0AAP0F9J0_9MAGN
MSPTSAANSDGKRDYETMSLAEALFQTYWRRARFHQPSYIEILANTEAATGIAMVILIAIAFSLATKLQRRRPSSLLSPLQKVIGFQHL